MTPAEAFEFISTNNFRLTPLLRKRESGIEVECWIVSDRTIGQNGRQNISTWLIRGDSALDAVRITKEWIDEQKLVMLDGVWYVNSSQCIGTILNEVQV